MGRLGFLYDQTRCVGCNACQMACKDAHNLEAGLFFRRAETLEFEWNGNSHCVHYSGACNHCEDAACVKACPTGAMHYEADGTVGHDRGKCIGCGACTWACPYGAPKLSRRLGISQKCDSCMERRKEGNNPFCVDACITHCLKFGDMEELIAEEAKQGRSDYTKLQLPFLPETGLTHPSVRVRRMAEFESLEEKRKEGAAP